MRFAEFHVGQVIEAGALRGDPGRASASARDRGPAGSTADPLRGEEPPLPKLIASGWQTCGIAMRLIADAVLAGSESYASPGLAYVKWLHPVRPGDALSVRATVLQVRRSSSQPHLGLLALALAVSSTRACREVFRPRGDQPVRLNRILSGPSAARHDPRLPLRRHPHPSGAMAALLSSVRTDDRARDPGSGADGAPPPAVTGRGSPTCFYGCAQTAPGRRGQLQCRACRRCGRAAGGGAGRKRSTGCAVR